MPNPGFPGQSGSLAPLVAQATGASAWGPRNNPYSGQPQFNQGVDISAGGNTQLLTNSGNQPLTYIGTYGASGGTENSAGGYTAAFSTPNGDVVKFMHIGSPPNLNVGDQVQPGQGLAVAGAGETTGYSSTGEHVKVYTYANDGNGNMVPVDPASAKGQEILSGVGYKNNPSDAEVGDAAGGDPSITAQGADPAKIIAAGEEGAGSVPGGNGETPPGGAAGGGAGGAGGAAGAAGAAMGGAGCAGGGPSLASLPVVGGLLGNLGGVAQGALINGAMAVLSGGGIQGAMGAVLGSVGGALGNSLGASLGGAAGAFVGQTLGGALGGIVAGQNPLQAVTGAAFGALSSMGGSLIPGLSNVLPAPLAQAAIQGLAGGLGAMAAGHPPGAAAQFALAGGLQGAISGYATNMTGNYTLGAVTGAVASGVLTGAISLKNNLYAQPSGQINILRFANNIATVAAVAGQNKNMVGAISEVTSQGFGVVTSGSYGAKYRNMQDVMTFSVTTLGQNLNAVAADMMALGMWDASNLMRLMQPGNVAAQILFKGLGGVTGLYDQLTSLGVPVAGIDNPLFDRAVQQALNTITGREEIDTVRAAFNMTTDVDNLGELTSLEKMMPRSLPFLPINNFRELGVHLAIIGISEQATLYKIGQAFSRLETSTDLNYINQSQQPMPPEIANQLLQIYGYGGGVYGEQTMADFIGTAAGYVHSDTAPVIRKTSDYIIAHPAGETLMILTELLRDTVAGVYTTLDEPGDTANGIPGIAGYIEVPFPSGTQTFYSLDDAIYAFIPLIEAEHQALLDNPDPELQDNIKKLEVAYNASCAQLIRESNNLLTHQVDLFSPFPPSPSSAMMFAQALEGWGLETGYGSPAEYIERVATPDLYGDCVKFVMRQSRNAQALNELGVDVEQFKLPRSQYYRDPEGFYNNLYTGAMPPKPANRTTPFFPKTAEQVYQYNRDQKLQDIGYASSPLTTDQKSEIYYDSLWVDTSEGVLEDVGRQMVKTALDRNTAINGNDLIIIGLDGSSNVFGKIAENGLILNNNEFFIDTMMQIVNRLLYGDIQTTKYNNPFNTDQMIFGVLELLAQVTNQNVEALMKTVTGGLIANGLLSQLLAKFGRTRSLYDTGTTRNDPAAYGGVGPDAAPL